MGRGADVKQMIAAADKNGDGKVRSILMACIPKGSRLQHHSQLHLQLSMRSLAAFPWAAVMDLR